MRATPSVKLGIVSLGVALALAACNNATPTPDPYANGAQYPWTDTGALGLAGTAALQSGYLSDQAWASATNGWGPAEKNTSNGEQAAGDGRTITINGKTFAKGLGVHANSRIQYNLGGQCSRFTAMVGVDDEATADKPSSVRFEVWADAKNLYNSGRMTARDAAKSVDLDITGKGDVILYVYDDGDGNTWDHADWADAKVVCGTVTPPPPPPPPNTVYLSDLPLDFGNIPGRPVAPTNGWGPIERDMSNGEQAARDGQTISIRGQKFIKGLGFHSDALFRIDLYAVASKLNCSNGFLLFKAVVGIDDETKGNGAASFNFSFGGTTPFGRAGPTYQLTGTSPAITIEYGISQLGEMQFTANTVGGNNYSAHVSLGNARFECVPLPTVQISSDKTVLTAPTTINLTATVSSLVGVRSVAFYTAFGDPKFRTPFAQDQTAPFTATFTVDGIGDRDIPIYASVFTDDAFALASSPNITIQYRPPQWSGTQTANFTAIDYALNPATNGLYVLGRTGKSPANPLVLALYSADGSRSGAVEFGDLSAGSGCSPTPDARLGVGSSGVVVLWRWQGRCQGSVSPAGEFGPWTLQRFSLAATPVPTTSFNFGDFVGASSPRVASDGRVLVTTTNATPAASGQFMVYLVSSSNTVTALSNLSKTTTTNFVNFTSVPNFVDFSADGASLLVGRAFTPVTGAQSQTYERWSPSDAQLSSVAVSNTLAFVGGAKDAQGYVYFFGQSILLSLFDFNGALNWQAPLTFTPSYASASPRGGVAVFEYNAVKAHSYSVSGAPLGSFVLPSGILISTPFVTDLLGNLFVVNVYSATQTSTIDKYTPTGTKL